MPKSERGFSVILLIPIIAILMGLAFFVGTKYADKPESVKDDSMMKIMPGESSTTSRMENQTTSTVQNKPVQNNPSESQMITLDPNKLKGYSSAQGKFILEYPGDLVAIESTLPISKNYPTALPSLSLEGPNMSMAITVAEAPKGMNLSNALGDGPNLQYDYSLLSKGNTKKIQVDGVEAIRVDGVQTSVGVSTDLILFRNGQIYELSFHPVSPDNTAKFEKILTSFKFTD